VPDLDTLRLHEDGLLWLSADEQQRLAGEFGQVFGDSGWRLRPTAAREMTLEGPVVDAEGPDPSWFAGQSLRELRLQGGEVATLRRLQAEIEMWLHAKSFVAQAGRERLRVNALWLWGCRFAATLARCQMTASASASPSTGESMVYANDLAARACAMAAGAHFSNLPESWPESRAKADCYAVLTVHGTAVTSQLADIEQHWLRPALEQRGNARQRILELVCGARRWTFGAAAKWRVWRRRRHWLPELLAC
jgi:hypothetical protein